MYADQTFNEFKTTLIKLFTEVGEDPSRDGLIETPQRIFKMYKELFNGYSQNPASVFKTFDGNGYQQLVSVTNIDFYSLCEHHMIPFWGQVHIGYVPNGKILGLSKFARLVDIFSSRLQTQENLTYQIMKAINTYLKPQGCIIHVEAEHLCVSMRGIKKKGFITKTTLKSGLLETRSDFTDQFYRDINSIK